MQKETFDSIPERITRDGLQKFFKTVPRTEIDKRVAKELIDAELAAMRDSGEIKLLTDEEVRLLRSFRRFKLTVKRAGVVFRWQTGPMAEDDLRLIVTEDTGLIRDPQDVSE